MNTKSNLIEPNLRDISNGCRNFQNAPSHGWRKFGPDYFNQIHPWSQIDDLGVSALDVFSSKFHPHQLERYDKSWVRVAEQQVSGETWFLHVNASGFHTSNTGLDIGIPILIVKNLGNTEVGDFEDNVVYNVLSALQINGPKKIEGSSLIDFCDILRNENFKTALHLLAIIAVFDFDVWGD